MTRTIATTLVLLTLLPATLARASASGVVDNAGFFSPAAVEDANKRIAETEKTYGRQMRVETYSEIPADRRDGYSEAGKRDFFQKWARELAEKANLRGVMVLICRNPSTLQVEI